jgi:hypothetical protein
MMKTEGLGYSYLYNAGNDCVYTLGITFRKIAEKDAARYNELGLLIWKRPLLRRGHLYIVSYSRITRGDRCFKVNEHFIRYNDIFPVLLVWDEFLDLFLRAGINRPD